MSVDAERQIRQMADFIELEAKEKASEIRAKAKADADAERQLAITSAKAKIADEFDKKERNLATEKKIAASMAEARQRSRLLAARQTFIEKLAAEAKARLANVAASNAQAYALLLKSLIKQAIESLPGEKTVEVHARPQDAGVAAKAAAAAAAEVSAEAGVGTITATAVADASLSGSAGGVVVWAAAGRIKCNNTLEARMDIVLHDLTPVIRDLLYPSARAEVRTKPPVFFAHQHAAHSAPAAHAAPPATSAAQKPVAPAVTPVAHVSDAVVAGASTGAGAAPTAAAAGSSDPFAF